MLKKVQKFVGIDLLIVVFEINFVQVETGTHIARGSQLAHNSLNVRCVLYCMCEL